MLILKDSDDGILHLVSLSLWTPSIIDFSAVAFYAKMCSWRHRLIQDKCPHRNKCKVRWMLNFLGFALFDTLHIK